MVSVVSVAGTITSTSSRLDISTSIHISAIFFRKLFSSHPSGKPLLQVRNLKNLSVPLGGLMDIVLPLCLTLRLDSPKSLRKCSKSLGIEDRAWSICWVKISRLLCCFSYSGLYAPVPKPGPAIYEYPCSMQGRSDIFDICNGINNKMSWYAALKIKMEVLSHVAHTNKFQI